MFPWHAGFSRGRRKLLKRTAAAGLSCFLPACGSPDTPQSLPASKADFADGALRLHWRQWRHGSIEHFTLERLRHEPEWPGRRKRLTDSPDWGDYRLSVYDPEREALIFRQGFDTSLNPAARTGTTTVSLRCPMPLRAIEVEIEKRRTGAAFDRVSGLSIDPAHDSVERAPREIAVQVDAIHAGGDPASKVDLAIVGDGYLEAEHPKFVRDAARAAGYLFSVEPFRSRKHDFSVHAVFAASRESGVTDAYLGLKKDTVFRCAYYAGGSERALADGDDYAVHEVAAVVPYDFILILANARRYGGSAYFSGPAVAAVDSAAARYLVIHEFAHAFAGLADEYYVPVPGGPVFRGGPDPWQPNVATSAQRAPWRHLVTEAGAQPARWNKSEYEKYFADYVKRYHKLREAGADETVVEKFLDAERARQARLLAGGGGARRVGFFEGANGYAKGMFRSEADCIMFSLQTDRFCAACSAAIERMIDEHSR
jgi:hypothetical protein